MADDTAPDRLAAIEDDLYGVPPDQFVERRDDAARAVERDGDQELSEEIRSLRKPTAAAWAVNSFARANPHAIDALLDVGARLRDAVASGDGDAIRALMRERARSTAATLALVRDRAAEQGRPLSTSVASQVEQTLRVAASSEDAARRLQRGVLSSALDDAGVHAMPARAARSGTSRPTDVRESADRGDVDEQRRQQAEERADEAASVVTRIEHELHEAAERRREIEAERDELRSRLEQIDGLLRQVRSGESDAQERLRSARSELRSARAALPRVR